MVKLDYLDYFEVYKTNPPVIMPENAKNRKKGEAFVVLAPSIDAELQYMSTDRILQFRNLSKYFIEKKWTHELYGSGTVIDKPNDDGEITALLEVHKRQGNLKGIDEVTSYLENSKSRPMKNFNVLVEVNHIIERIIGNHKDRRALVLKARDLMPELTRMLDLVLVGNYVGEYKLTTIIPLELWLTKDDLNNRVKLLKRTSPKLIGHLLSYIMSESQLQHFGRLLLVYDNLVMQLDAGQIPEKSASKPDFIAKQISLFLDKCRIHRTPQEDEPDPTIESTEAKLTEAEKLTKLDVATDRVLTSVRIDPDTVPAEKKNAVKVVVAKAAVKSETRAKGTQDAESVNSPTTNPVVVNRPGKSDVKKVSGSNPADGRPMGTLRPGPTKAKVVTPKSTQVTATKTIPNVNDSSQEVFEVPEHADTDEFTIPQAEVEDVVLQAKMSGKSVQSYQRDQALREKYGDLRMGEKTLAEIEQEEVKYEVPTTEVRANVVNPEYKEIRSHAFEKAYNENLATKDLANILLHFSHVQPPMYLNKDIQIEDVSTSSDRMLRYTVEFEDEKRKRHRFSFLLPKMYKEKYLYLNGKQMDIIHQKFPYPVTKIGPDRAQVVSNYNKIIVTRYGANLSPLITKLKKLFTGPSCPSIAKVTPGDANPLNVAWLTSMEYDELGASMLQIKLGNITDSTTIFFEASAGAVAIGTTNIKPNNEDPTHLLPLAIRVNTRTKNKDRYFLSGSTNLVYDESGESHGELSSFIIEVASWYDEKFPDQFANISAGTKFVYNRCRIMRHDVPIVFVLGAADPGGLVAVLEKAQINFSFTEKRPAVDREKQGVVPFADGYLVFDRYPYENSLLLNGLSSFPTKELNFYDMGSRDTYVDIFDTMFGSRTLIDGIENFYYMMIDPITMDILVRLSMPTDFTRLMLYCNGMLADNRFNIDSAYYNSRIRSNEMIYAILYKHLADAWGLYRDGRAEKFSIREDAVIKTLITSNNIDPHTKLNVTLEVENDRQIKLKGPSGMNEDRSFTLEKRAFEPSMRGIVGMNSTPSGKVGIGRHMTLNSNITDARGFVQVNKEDYDGTELATPGELLQTFGPESADIERVAMSISQSKHLVPVASQTSCPITYDMERVVPYISSDFAAVAKHDGQVVALENDVLIVKYTDGSVDDVDLSEHPDKNSDGGFFVMNQMKTDLKVGAKVKKGDILAYDPKYMNKGDLFGDIRASVGTMARVSIETNGDVFEDACYITDNLAHRLATKITQEKKVILSKFANIKYIAKVGQKVTANDPILMFDDTEDEFASQMLAGMAAEMEDEDLVVATSAPVITKVSGVIKDIKIYYTVPIEELSPSMQKLVGNYVKDAQKREKTISKYKPLYDANTIPKSSKISIPDFQGKVNGVKVGDGVFIDFYIEYEDIMSSGDKLTNFTALKGVVCEVIPANLAAYTESEPDIPIDAGLSCIGVYKRMTLDIIKVGGLVKLVRMKKRHLKEKYGQAIKDALKTK